MKYPKLRLRILEKFGTYGNFAKAINKTADYVTRYMQGHTMFNQSTICTWCEALDISIDEIGSYFFALAFCETQKESE